MKIKVVTFNIRHGKGIDGKTDLERIAQVLRDSQADLIGLNEVDKEFGRRSCYLNQAAELAKHLKMHYAFGEAIHFKKRSSSTARQYGNAFLSCFPILSCQNRRFGIYTGVTESRAVLKVKINIKQQPVSIYITHLPLNPVLHRIQTNFILNQISHSPESVILMGDWNMKPGSKAWKKISTYLHDVCPYSDTNTYHTYPSLYPRRHLDYIFISRDFTVSQVEVIHTLPQASDHLPLQATLFINKNQSTSSLEQ